MNCSFKPIGMKSLLAHFDTCAECRAIVAPPAPEVDADYNELAYPAWIEEGMFNGMKLDPKYAIPASAI